jgi:hypothetical protein
MRELWWFLLMQATILAGFATLYLDLGPVATIVVWLVVSLSGPAAYCVSVLWTPAPPKRRV